VKMNRVETSFGTIYIKKHELFNQQGLTNNGMFLDLMNIRKRVFQPMKTEKLKLAEAGTRYVDASLISEICCLEKRYEATHGMIVGS
jgi:hypothetical protein